MSSLPLRSVEPPSSRCDLHVHSRASDQPSEWYLARLGSPESFTDPHDVYRLARARGMDFVTISDHDTIAGGLEIAHLPGAFLSCEITAAFPEDGCEIHLLAWGLTEEDHRETQRLRRDLYALRGYLRERSIVHAIAHPLFRVNDRLTVDHLEKLLVLFRRFEGINGQRDLRASELFRVVADALSPADLLRLAERHRLDAEEVAPSRLWTGGSDDHCGLYIGSSWTETPRAMSVTDFLGRLADGDHRPGGEHGSSLKLARSFQALAHDYYRQKVLAGSRWRNDPLADLLRRIAAGELESRRGEETGWMRSLRLAISFLPSLTTPRPALVLAARAARRHGAEAAITREEERAIFEGASALGHRAIARALEEVASAVERGRPAAALPALSTLATGVVALSPYIAAFRFEHSDEPLLGAVCDRFPAAAASRRKSRRVVWATDSLFETNGVARTLRETARRARALEAPLTVLATGRETPPRDFDCEIFRPIWEHPVPRYDELALRLPPVVEVAEFIEREGFGEVVVSTPGPVGLAALAAARLLGLPTTGLYHTDLPRYVAELGFGDALAGHTRTYLRWFYGQLDRVLVSARSYHEELLRWGLDPSRLGPFPHGVDSAGFRPDRRVAGFFERWALGGGPVFLYVGRLSREKHLLFLLEALERLRASCPTASLALVGDGPQRDELVALRAPGVALCGLLHGDELAAAYASADVFVYPSRTDTFGNAVLEALASGVPAVVAAEGGPAEQIFDSGAGRIADASSPAAWSIAMHRLADDDVLRHELGRRGRRWAEAQSWDRLLEVLMRSDRSAVAGAGEVPAERESAVAV